MSSETRYYALKLSALIVLVYAVQLIAPEITEILGFRAVEFPSNYWAIFTSFFIHSVSDYMHLINNLFFLAIFGTVLEYYIGSKKFILFFVAAGLFANLSAFIYYPESLVLGASGAVSGIIAYLAVIKPRKIGLFWGAPLPMWLVGLMWVVTNLVSVGADAGIAFEAHLFGLGFGGLIAVFYRSSETGKKATEEDLEISEEDIRRWEERYMT